MLSKILLKLLLLVGMVIGNLPKFCSLCELKIKVSRTVESGIKKPKSKV